MLTDWALATVLRPMEEKIVVELVVRVQEEDEKSLDKHLVPIPRKC